MSKKTKLPLPGVVGRDQGREVVSFPDKGDSDDLPSNPFAIRSRTDTGDQIRPAVVVALLNENMKNKLMKKLRAKAQERGLPEPIITPARLSERDTTDKMADLLLSEWEKYHKYFPLKTLKNYLDDRTAKIMEEAFLTGRPIDRDAVRRAIGALWQEAQQKRNEKT